MGVERVMMREIFTGMSVPGPVGKNFCGNRGRKCGRTLTGKILSFAGRMGDCGELCIIPGWIAALSFSLLSLIVMLVGPAMAVIPPAYADDGTSRGTDASVETFASFDFIRGKVENGFDNWIYSDINHNDCGIYKGKFQSKLCEKDSRGRSQSIYIHYLNDNNDHMGWLRWGFLDAAPELTIRGGALKLVLTGGAWNQQGRVAYAGREIRSRSQLEAYLAKGKNPHADIPLPGDVTLYFKSHSPTGTFKAFQGKNRLSVWMLMPESHGDAFEKQQFSLVYRRPEYTVSLFPFIDDSRGGHYYHSTTNIPLGGWTRIIFDAHPWHHNGGDKNPYSFYRTGGKAAPGDAEEYFSRIVTFALRGEMMSNRPSPSSLYIDEITLQKIDHENEETISTLGVGFDPETRRFDVGFNDKYRCGDCSARYEIRYGFAPITQKNYTAASLCRVINFKRRESNHQGIIHKPANGYNQIWAGLRLRPEDEKKLREGVTLYFALKDVSNRSHLGQRDGFDLETVKVPGMGDIRRKDLIRTIDYTIFPVHRLLQFRTRESTYKIPAGKPWEFSIKASGGEKPYWYGTTDSLPKGLYLKGDGHLTGIPLETGIFEVTVSTVDARHQRISKSIVLWVLPPEKQTALP